MELACFWCERNIWRVWCSSQSFMNVVVQVQEKEWNEKEKEMSLFHYFFVSTFFALILMLLYLISNASCNHFYVFSFSNVSIWDYILSSKYMVRATLVAFYILFLLLGLIICCCSVTKSHPTLCHHMDCSIPGFLVLHCLPEFSQTCVHWVNDAVQPSYPVIPFSSCSQSSPQYFSMTPCIRCPKYWNFDFNISPSSKYSELISFRIDWFDLLKGTPRVFSSTTFESINSLPLSLLFGPTLTSVHDHWQNHSFD